MNFKHIETGSFIVETDKEKAGHLEYTYLDKNTINIDSTDVYPDYRGRELGKALVLKVVELARERNLKIKTTCPFAGTLFKRKENEWADVMA